MDYYTRPLRAAIAVALTAVLLWGCDRQQTAEVKRSAETAGKKLDDALDRTGAKLAASMKDGALADTAITASIKTDFLKDPDLSVLKIDVDTANGVVTLNGLAGNEAARGRAEKIAGSIKGVREVRNYLTVKRA